jgi:integrase
MAEPRPTTRSPSRSARRAKSATPTLGEWAATWLEARRQKVASKTFENERSHLRYLAPLFDDQLDALTPGRIEDWLGALERSFLDDRPSGRPHTVRICFSLLSSILRDAAKHRIIATSPMKEVQRPRVPAPTPKFLTLSEARTLVEACDATGDPRALAVALMVHLGLRRNEALGLIWSDVDLETGALNLSFQLGRDRTGDGALARRPLKTVGSRRRLRLFPELVGRLETTRTRGARTLPDDFIISLGGGRPVDPDAMSRWLSRCGRDVGLRVSPHRLRHTAATLMLNSGTSIETVGRVLGHSEVRTTSIYARVLDSSTDDALESLAGVLSNSVPRTASVNRRRARTSGSTRRTA